MKPVCSRHCGYKLHALVGLFITRCFGIHDYGYLVSAFLPDGTIGSAYTPIDNGPSSYDFQTGTIAGKVKLSSS